MIKLSGAAIEQIKKLISQEKEPSKVIGLRVKVRTGGCAGFSYVLDFETTQKEDDKVFEQEGVKVLIDDKSFLYLIGTTLDFDGGLNGQGFVFDNPNASKGCGCGSSFNV